MPKNLKLHDDLVDISTLEGMMNVVFVEEKTVMERDWSQLPSELLELIAENVVSISNFIRFRSVCMPWRRAATPRKLRRQPPIALLRYSISNPDKYFFSIATGRVHCISLPQLTGKIVMDSINGWMLLYDVQTKALSLHNPVSLAYDRLPPTDSFLSKLCFCRLFYDQFADNFVVLISDFPRDDADVAGLWFFKIGDESWSVLKIDFEHFYHLTIYHKGKFFAFAGDVIYIIDVSVTSCNQSLSVGLIEDIPQNFVVTDFFSVTANGELFLVSDYGHKYHYKSFLLYKIDYDGRQIKLSKVQPEDYALFFMATFERPVMFCVKDFPQYKKNHAYTLILGINCEDGKRCLYTNVSVMNCKDDTMDLILCGWESPDNFIEYPRWISQSFQ